MSPTGREIARYLKFLNATDGKYRKARVGEWNDPPRPNRTGMTLIELLEMRQAIERMTRGIA